VSKRLAILCILFAFIAGITGSQQEHGARLSLVQLIANPERYDGKLVNVTGFLTMNEEGTTLWYHETDFDHALTENALSIDRTKDMNANRERLEFNYVLIVGTFRDEKRSLRYSQTGRITNITRFELWSQLSSPRNKSQREGGR
jgi:hypothetical protein